MTLPSDVETTYRLCRSAADLAGHGDVSIALGATGWSVASYPGGDLRQSGTYGRGETMTLAVARYLGALRVAA